MKKITAFFFSSLFVLNCYADNKQPKLILQLVVDQLRGDLIQQHKDQFGASGFNYLVQHGLDFHNAHHPHANTTTCAGHSTIATGSYPSLHGIVDNDWYDRDSKAMMYCMNDPKESVLKTGHTKKAIPGRSAENLKASTLSDELILANKGKAFAVSLKDRSAIALAGHAGKAFWFDKVNGGFVTSSYYYSNYPKWVQKWNEGYSPKAYAWTLSQNIAIYKNANTPAFRSNYGSFGHTFPHHAVNPPTEEYFKALSRTPKADELTANFAEQLLVEEKLGITADQTDYLAISFSAVDAIGHQFGPNSLEAEDNLIQLDSTLGHLLSVIDKQVGLGNTLIVLTADHGVSDSPSFLKAHHIAEVEPVNIPAIEQYIRNQLTAKYQLPASTLMTISPPYIYLDHQIISDHKLNLAKISREIAISLSQQPGIFRAFALPITNIEKDWLSAKVDHMAYPNRSGDIYIVQPAFQSHGAKNEDRVAHGSPWQYDSYVPLLFVNPGFDPKRIARPVYTTDIAATLAALLMIKAPSATVGKPLNEVLTAYQNIPSLKI